MMVGAAVNGAAANAAMQHDVRLSADGKVLAVHVPMTFRKRGGRKVVVAPGGVAAQPSCFVAPRATIDSGLIRAVVQAHRWQQMLDEQRFATIEDLARAEKLDRSFVSRTLRLTLLAPDIVEAILDGRQSAATQRQTLLHGFPLAWNEQRQVLGQA